MLADSCIGFCFPGFSTICRGYLFAKDFFSFLLPSCTSSLYGIITGLFRSWDVAIATSFIAITALTLATIISSPSLSPSYSTNVNIIVIAILLLSIYALQGVGEL